MELGRRRTEELDLGCERVSGEPSVLRRTSVISLFWVDNSLNASAQTNRHQSVLSSYSVVRKATLFTAQATLLNALARARKTTMPHSLTHLGERGWMRGA